MDGTGLDGTSVEVLRSLAAQFAAFQALLLLASILQKIARWPHSVAVVREFGQVPAALVTPLLVVTLGIEIVAAGSLLVPAYRGAGAVLAASVFGVYLALIVRAILQGRRDVDCGCSFGPAQGQLGSFQVARNTILLILSLLIATATGLCGGGALLASQMLAACALLALYGALDQVMALVPLRGGETA